MTQASPWENLKNQIYLGSEAFVEEIRSKLSGNRDLSEVPAAQRRQTPKPIEEYARETADRNEAIRKAYAGGYGQREIGAYFGLHYSRVSRIVTAAEKAKGKT